MKWSVATIGEVCEVVSGATPKTGRPEFWDGNVPWVTPKDLSNLGQKHFIDTPRHITKAGLKSCSARMLPAQSVLLSSRAPIGLVAINTLPVCTNQGFKSLVPRFDLVSPDFLFWWLKTHEKHIQSKGRGATFKEVSKKIVEDLQIPLPPLPEQRRIADILDKADALRAKRRAALAQLDTLTQSIFLDMFGDPATNPNGWEMATIGEMTTCLDRLRQPVKAADRVNGDIPYYGANGQQGWIHEALFDEPLILVAEDGGHFGDPARGVAYRIDGPSWVNNHAHVLRPAETIDVEYLHRALRHYDFGAYISGSTRTKLNQAQLNKAKLPLPPLDLQHFFAAIIESVEKQQEASHRVHLATLDTLFASLQSRAFRGEL